MNTPKATRNSYIFFLCNFTSNASNTFRIDSKGDKVTKQFVANEGARACIALGSLKLIPLSRVDKIILQPLRTQIHHIRVRWKCSIEQYGQRIGGSWRCLNILHVQNETESSLKIYIQNLNWLGSHCGNSSRYYILNINAFITTQNIITVGSKKSWSSGNCFTDRLC